MRVVAVRYTDDVARLARFLEQLGLSRRTSADTGGFVDLVAGRGVVMVHATSTSTNHVGAGWAELSFETDDLEATADGLAGMEHDVMRWDESYGEHLAIRDPRGDGIWVDAAMTDFYGYTRHDPRPNDLELVALRHSVDLAADTAFYTGLGFEVRARSDGHRTTFASAGGVIDLHRPHGDLPVGPMSPDNPAAPPALITVSFETHEPLQRLHDRLMSQGIAAILEADGPGPGITVVDPDGVEIEIRPAP